VIVSLSGALQSGRAATVPSVVFNKDVAPIVFKSCVGCHRPNDIAPMSLLTYRDAHPIANTARC
jgi:hypothetical protein